MRLGDFRKGDYRVMVDLFEILFTARRLDRGAETTELDFASKLRSHGRQVRQVGKQNLGQLCIHDLERLSRNRDHLSDVGILQ